MAGCRRARGPSTQIAKTGTSRHPSLSGLPARWHGSGTSREPDCRGSLDAGVVHRRAQYGAAGPRLGILERCKLVAHGDVLRVIDRLVYGLVLYAHGLLGWCDPVVHLPALRVVGDLVATSQAGRHGAGTTRLPEGPLGVAVGADEVALRDLGAQGSLAGAQGGDGLVPPRVARSPENGAATEELATARPMV